MLFLLQELKTSSPISEDYGEIGKKSEEEYLISWENMLKEKKKRE